MTAEIAIYNKSAIALAADSAVTIGNNRKIYNTAIKLFALSKFHPVGIMMYANSEFMGVPWETIIKHYRACIQNRQFGTLAEHGSSFIGFLQEKNNILFDDINKKYFFTQHVRYIANRNIKDFDEHLKKKIFALIRNKEATRPDEKILTSLEEDFLKTRLSEIKTEATESKITISDLKEAFADTETVIGEVISNRLTLPFPLSEANKAILTEIIELKIVKNWNDYTGIVIAGFGENDIYPCYIEYTVEALYGSKLKYMTERQKVNGHEGDSAIVPFAHAAIVSRFIEGVDPIYQEEIEKMLDELLSKIPETFLSTIPKLTEKDKTELQKQLKEVTTKEAAKQKSRLEDHRQKNFVRPIVDNLANLPKEELASMAEALVNITMFKQRISYDDSETVGGPIDVAVISKGDGFVWIKRKHYFDPKLNHHFFENYFNITKEGNPS